MTKKIKDKLPSKSWLIKNRYGELVKCMNKHPEIFAHIEQEEKPNTGETK